MKLLDIFLASMCVSAGHRDKNLWTIGKFRSWLCEMSKLLTFKPPSGLPSDILIKNESSKSLSLTSRWRMLFSFMVIEVSLLTGSLRWRMFGDQDRSCGGMLRRLQSSRVTDCRPETFEMCHGRKSQKINYSN